MTEQELLKIIQEAAKQKSTFLDLSWKGISSIPAEISQLTSLKQLYIYGNKLSNIPLEISQLTSLQYLNISRNKISNIPPEIAQLTSLHCLAIYGNKLSNIPPEISQLTSLQKLDISGNQISNIPPEISQLTSLQYLNVSGNQISNIPPEISRLTSLKDLAIYLNQISNIPPEISRLTSLQYLDISSNQISNIPPEISQLTFLKYLDLRYNQINSIPLEISQLTSLKYLDLRDNKISSIPPEISQLTSLQHLDLRDNKISSIPPEIAQLTSLEYLDLSFNQIKSLPPEIAQLNFLQYLDLSGNPLETPPPEIVAKGIKAIKDFFGQVQAEGYDTIYEAKLIIVGEGYSGKTSLMNKILDPNYVVPQDEEAATHGINIKIFRFPFNNEQDFRVNIWDFGGQAIYHETHQFFLTKRSLYALVADSRKEHEHLDYWLQIVDLLSKNSPMLIIKNEKDNCSVDIKDESQIKGTFHQMVQEILTTDLATNRNLEQIIEAIKYQIKKLPHVGIKIPKSWAKVRKAIEEDNRDHISLKEYLKICNRCQFSQQTSFDKTNNNKDGRLTLSQFFHDLGIILHFQDDKASVLYDTVILNPEWGTQAVYELLKRENNPIKAKLGKFDFDDLEIIWSDDRYQRKHRELLELMKRFKLCYELPHKTYIAPQLLDQNPPNYPWDTENNLKLRYHYDFMPKGILSRFIVEMHSYIDEPNVWRSGVILRKDNTYAEIIETYKTREIQIKLRGNNKRGLLEIILAKFDEIHNSYYHLKVDKLIPCNCDTCKNLDIPYFHKLENLRNILSKYKQESQCQKSAEMVNIYSLIDDTIGREQLHRSNQEKYGNIDFKDVETVIINQGDTNIKPTPKQQESSQTETIPKLPFAFRNGMFYLLVFEIVAFTFAIMANSLPVYSLIVVIIATILIFILVGVFQLMADKSVSETSFVKLVEIVVKQLPVFGSVLQSIQSFFQQR